MKIALIRCRTSCGPRETNVTGMYPPLGLAYVGAVLQRAGYEVTVVDAEALRLSVDAMLDAIPADVAMIGFTGTTLAWPSVRLAAAKVRERFPEAVMVLGGPHVTAFPEDSLVASAFDVGVIGDGEVTVVEIADRLSRGESLLDVPGCVVKDGDDVRSNLPVEWIKDIDSLPLPALDLLPMSSYRSVAVRYPFVTMISSRGCPFRCRFCAQIYSGGNLRTRSPESIVDEMERAVREYGAKEIVLFDETFGVRRNEALKVCSLIRERGLEFRWNARTRIDVIDEELLRAMRDAGCYALHLGVESGTQRILDEMNKKITPEKIRESIDLAGRLGFRVHAYFMIGYPSETRAEIAETLRFSRELKLDWASYTITIPNPRTPLFEKAWREGYIDENFWREYTLGKPTGNIPFFASEECPVSYLNRAKKMAYLRFYARPYVLFRNLTFFVESGGWSRILYAAQLWMKEALS